MLIKKEMFGIISELKKFLKEDVFARLFEIVSRNELSDAVDCMCNQLVENQIIIPERLSRRIQNVVAKLGLDPSKTWKNIPVQNEDSLEKYRLTIGKDPLEIFVDIHSIWHEIRNKVPLDGARDIDEFISVGENELAIESICSAIRCENIVIAQRLLNKIRAVLYCLSLDPCIVINIDCYDDSFGNSHSKLVQNTILIEGLKKYPQNCQQQIENVKGIYQEISKNLNHEDSALIEEFLACGEAELATDIICAALIKEKIPISNWLLEKIRKSLDMSGRSKDTWAGFIPDAVKPAHLWVGCKSLFVFWRVLLLNI